MRVTRAGSDAIERSARPMPQRARMSRLGSADDGEGEPTGESISSHSAEGLRHMMNEIRPTST